MTDSTQPEPRDRSDRAGATPWRLPIAQIQPYERNPRHGRNPEYDRIKDSIRSHGLDQPLVITQRPGAADYIVHAGGKITIIDVVMFTLFDGISGDAERECSDRVPCRCWC